MNKKRKPLELYVHIPFCIRKCAYCDFVSGPGTKAMQKEYEEALLAEIDAAEETAESEVISAFFGGGYIPGHVEYFFVSRLAVAVIKTDIVPGQQRDLAVLHQVNIAGQA